MLDLLHRKGTPMARAKSRSVPRGIGGSGGGGTMFHPIRATTGQGMDFPICSPCWGRAKNKEKRWFPTARLPVNRPKKAEDWRGQRTIWAGHPTAIGIEKAGFLPVRAVARGVHGHFPPRNGRTKTQRTRARKKKNSHVGNHGPPRFPAWRRGDVGFELRKGKFEGQFEQIGAFPVTDQLPLILAGQKLFFCCSQRSFGSRLHSLAVVRKNGSGRADAKHRLDVRFPVGGFWAVGGLFLGKTGTQSRGGLQRASGHPLSSRTGRVAPVCIPRGPGCLRSSGAYGAG